LLAGGLALLAIHRKNRILSSKLGLAEASSRRLLAHVGIARWTQQIKTTVHFFFVVQLLVSIDRNERAVARAPSSDDVLPSSRRSATMSPSCMAISYRL
jgi:hypothetical protein